MNASSPLLRNANKAYVTYCTSDAHMGNATAFGFHFRGNVVVQSVLTDLVRRGLGGSSVKDILLFGGASAGARGAMVQLDYVSSMLGHKAAENVGVTGFLDSPLWIDITPFNPEFIGFRNITKEVHSFANVVHLGEECTALYPNHQDQWKCMFGQYRLPTVQTPYFLVASQNDAYQLENLMGGHEPNTSAETVYAEKFAALTLGNIKSLYSGKSGRGVFSWACYNHATSGLTDGFDKYTCSQPQVTTMEQALERYLAGLARSGERSVLTSSDSSRRLRLGRRYLNDMGAAAEWYDDCQGFNCGTGC